MPGKKRTPVTGEKVHGVRDMKALPRTRTFGAPVEAIGNAHETLARQPKPRPKEAHILPKSLSRQIARVHRLAREAGLFLEDRDFLHCAHCGLLEDVGCFGLLMTYPTGQPPVDSGLRFKKDKRGLYVCPACGAVVRTNKEKRTTT